MADVDLTREGIGMTSQRTRNRLVEQLRKLGIENETVLSVISRTPRHLFLEPAISHQAYDDKSLPIGYGQTISRPYTVARMTELVLGRRSFLGKVLEIGTGCGYQSAVLSPFAGELYSVERIEPLHKRASQQLTELGYKNIEFTLSDGSWGWEDKGPFDGILAAASPEKIPQSLIEQLADGGRLILPVGGEKQVLTLVTRDGDDFHTEVVEEALFVPFLPGIQR
ncbi:MAG: protein-L-isoaspartate O-methyltransferase [Oceanospirillaceae bacterium]|nr:protein-L-isoaspartate O-methyltransferase [Oceanospirillaceae bacterium]